MRSLGNASQRKVRRRLRRSTSTAKWERSEVYAKVEQQLNKSHALIGRWSSTWSWQKRSRDYDNELKRQELEEQRKAVKKMQERQIQTAMLLQKKGCAGPRQIAD